MAFSRDIRENGVPPKLKAITMINKNNFSRRSFIRTSSLATGGIIASTVLPKKIFGTTHGWPAINPNIDNLRVVCCYDTTVISTPAGTTFADQNNATDTTKVEANMDEMARSLAQKTTAAEAWATIFRKPAAKNWNAVKCAIKVNCFYISIMPRVAIVGKICKELINLGCTASNIVVYDDRNAAGSDKYTPYIGSGLPTGTVVGANSSLGGTTSAYIDAQFGSQLCTTNIANGVVDILVNIAVNKAHSSPGFTLCMKNHFGTFYPVCGISGFGSSYRYAYAIAINKTNAIVGGDPARQQLCIIDTLWASVTGNANPVTHAPARIIMGTLCPAVDYLCITKIWRDVYGRTLDPKVATIMTDYGYTATERDAMVLTDVPPATTTPAIALSPTSLTFGAEAGSANPSAQTVNVTNTGGGALAVIDATVTYGSGSGWLSVAEGGSGNSQTVTNTVSTGSMAAGTYTAAVSVASTGAGNTPQTYNVTFTLSPSTAATPITGRLNMLKQDMRGRFGGAYTITGRKISGEQLPAGGIYFRKGQKLNRIK